MQAVFEVGNVLAEWMAGKIKRAHPGLWGLREQPFYLAVPLEDRAAIGLIRSRLRPHAPVRGHPDECCWKRTMFYGWPIDDFTPPKIEYIGQDQAGRLKLRVRGITPLLERDNQGHPLTKDEYHPSVVLDAARGLVYVVTYIDGMILHDEHGLTLIEQKTMSNFAFRRALLGEIEYRYQCQLIGTLAALKPSGVTSALWLLHRKETQHLLEIGFVKQLDSTRVTLTAPNGLQETYTVTNRTALVPTTGGPAREFPIDNDWEAASLWTPYEAMEGVLASITQRILRVLTADPARGWHREYGPDFRCRRCAGAGRLTCSYCRGTGVSVKSGKVCGACGPKGKNSISVQGQIRCSDAKGGCAGRGILDQADLSFPCAYCMVWEHCLGAAGAWRVIEKRRPRLLVTRAGWQASGLTFEPPAPLELQAEVDEGEEEDDE